MALFNESDFADCCIPVFAKELHKDKSVTQIFGKVSAEHTPLLRYISLMYDQKSPMRLKISDIQLRKEECYEMSELKGAKDQIFDLSYDNILVYINAYLKHQSSKIWAVMTANEEVLWQYQQELLTPIRDFKNDKDKLQALEIKTKLMQECDAIIKRIDAYEEKIFGDNTDKKKEILNLTPESIANV